MYVSAKHIKEYYDITNQTLYNWRRLSKIEFKRLPSGKIVYVLDSKKLTEKHSVIYARVSNTKQKDDLLTQISIIKSFMVSNGVIPYEIYEDVASGMNENRKSFNKLMSDVIDGKIENIYISYKDRLTRFGFEYFETIFKKFGTNIIVINSTSEEDFQTELTQDLVSIIHHFSMKMYSNRRKLLKELKLKMENIEEV